jgi:hypothetical protein
MKTAKLLIGATICASTVTGLWLQFALMAVGSFLILWSIHDLIMANEVD